MNEALKVCCDLSGFTDKEYHWMCDATKGYDFTDPSDGSMSLFMERHKDRLIFLAMKYDVDVDTIFDKWNKGVAFLKELGY